MFIFSISGPETRHVSTVASAPSITGSAFVRRFRIYLEQCAVFVDLSVISTNKIVSLTYLETKGPHFLKSIFGKVYYVTFQKVFLMEGKKTLAVCHLSALAS